HDRVGARLWDPALPGVASLRRGGQWGRRMTATILLADDHVMQKAGLCQRPQRLHVLVERHAEVVRDPPRGPEAVPQVEADRLLQRFSGVEADARAAALAQRRQGSREQL